MTVKIFICRFAGSFRDVDHFAPDHISTIPDRNSYTIVGTTIPVDNVDAIDDADIFVLDIEPHNEYKAQFQHDIPSNSTMISPIENPSPNPPSRPKRHLHNRIIYDGELIQPRKRRRHRN